MSPGPIGHERVESGRARMNSMRGMMTRKMMDKTLIATEDGGVIVMVGNKLIKYDKDLNLIKEVEIKVDMDEMKEFMFKRKEGPRMYKKMMEGKTPYGEDEKDDTQEEKTEN